MEGDKPKKKFKRYPIGYVHIDLAELRAAEGKLYMFVAIDRTSKFAFVRLEKKAGKMTAAQFLRDLVAALPYRIHTILTDNGIQFTNRKQDRYAMKHIFDQVCSEHGIEHRLAKVNHPWTNGQVERMNRTIKEATVKRYHYEGHAQFETHIGDFIAAYNYAASPPEAAGPNAIRVHVQNLDKSPRKIHCRSNPSNAGTKHLDSAEDKKS